MGGQYEVVCMNYEEWRPTYIPDMEYLATWFHPEFKPTYSGGLNKLEKNIINFLTSANLEEGRRG